MSISNECLLVTVFFFRIFSSCCCWSAGARSKQNTVYSVRMYWWTGARMLYFDWILHWARWINIFNAQKKLYINIYQFTTCKCVPIIGLVEICNVLFLCLVHPYSVHRWALFYVLSISWYKLQGTKSIDMKRGAEMLEAEGKMLILNVS